MWQAKGFFWFFLHFSPVLTASSLPFRSSSPVAAPEALKLVLQVVLHLILINIYVYIYIHTVYRTEIYMLVT